MIPGHTDDALDEVLGVRGHEADELADAADDLGDRTVLDRRDGLALEHDDVAPLGVVEPVGELLDDDAVVDCERVLHRRGRDVEDLDDERAENERQPEGDQQQDGQLAEERPDVLVVIVLVVARAEQRRVVVGTRGTERRRRRRSGRSGRAATFGEGVDVSRFAPGIIRGHWAVDSRFSLMRACLPTRSRR